ncbi:dihydrofolate reductase [Tamlana sp. 2_MG-2023]|uniref:dihydrofolate reductase n=1 Tax=unclassified Tamlana TaxID=2614803 RepID=UPI0026E355ED|nr:MULTISPECIES: dihydrofolate reductase [unclassified Tamlana]MDO6760655.1 dihydrofolate reductase [Tamlana sp. 2_MG-2023]MDO6790911.1 dihydrofolate reductase [Tamlana sp. 1_MG-2023]
MFGKKKSTPQIDKEQLELIKNAQKRIKQKKRLYFHFVLFLIGSAFLIFANTVLGMGTELTQILGTEWFLFAILIWLFFLMYHTFNVFVTYKFMGKDWEQKQLAVLVDKQKKRIEQLQSSLPKETPVSKQPEIKEIPAVKTINSNQELTVIVAAAENNAIGKDNKLIWHLGDDLKRFKRLTNGHHIIMGRKTFESFPKPLPNRIHVVISRQQDYQVPEGVIVVNSFQDAIDFCKNDPQPYIIGGGEIYKQALSVADKIELTRVHENFDADTYFPQIDMSVWKESHNTFHTKDGNHDHEFSFITYVRK